jgi:F0F1-type ATP synthase membrane subunit b/b'
MNTETLSDTVVTLWTAAIVLGFVVVLAVAALLTVLVILVRRIDKRVKAIKSTLTTAEANTANAKLLTDVAQGVDGVLAEGLEHHLFLGRVLDKVRA